MFAHTLMFLPAAGLLIAVAGGIMMRTRREREDQHAREVFKITE
jgi:hypothetical protein